MVSSVTGHFLDVDAATNPAYWDENMVSQVNFESAACRCFCRSAQEQPQMKLDQSHLDEFLVSGILEIGPHSTLKAPLRQILDVHGRSNEVFYIAALVRGKTAKETVLDACGRLYSENVRVRVELLTSWCRTSATRPMILTKLPKYSFDHSALYWEENHMNRNIRLQRHGYNKFLGFRMNSGALIDARWRLILRTDEQPWIKDHVINGANIYPGAGMLVMALEAAKQLLWESPPKAFVFENVEFIAPILLSDTPAGTEVEICLSLINTDKGSTHYQFRIATRRRDDSCEEVCHGSISADYGRVASEVSGDNDSKKGFHIWAQLEKAERSCNITVDDFYGSLRAKCGADFGPTFQRLQTVTFNIEGDVIASLSPYEEDCIVHPVVLDATFQAFNAMPGENSVRTMVPRRVRKLWISASGIGHECSSKELIYARTTMPTRRTAVSSISVLRQASREVGLLAEDFEYTAVSEDSGAVVSGGETKHLVAHMIWKPDLDLFTRDQLREYCNRYRDAREDPVEYFRDWEVVCMALASRALSTITTNQLPTLELAYYVSWLKTTIASARRSGLPKMINLLDACIEEDNVLGALCDKVAMKKNGKVSVELGKNLTKILDGELDPLATIFEDEQLMKDYYDEMLYESRPLKSMQAYVDVLVHKRPDMKFLEIGAGTGGSTNTILEVLDEWAGPRYRQYVFTDISPSFLEKARVRFSNRNHMKFRPLNIEKDPLEQGFFEHEFDVIVADMVLHATSDLNKTLRHVRMLLKPGGKLILKEVVNKSTILAGFVFGVLPGWWLSAEKSRINAQSPCVDEAEWDLLLRSNHFSGTDLIMRDFEADDCHVWSYLISTAVDADERKKNDILRYPAPLIVVQNNSVYQAGLAEQVFSALDLVERCSGTLTLNGAANLTDLSKKDFIILLESEEPVLVNLTQELFISLQRVLNSARSIVWVTQSCYTMSPAYGIITGVARVLRVENNSTHIVTLGLETQDTARIATYVSTVFNATQAGLEFCFDTEPEYMEQSNVLNINRVISSKAINEHIFRRTTRPIVHQLVGDNNIRLGIRSLGLLDTLEFSEEISTDQELSPNEVVVRVQSIGVNFKDCLTLLGRIDTDVLGSECAGTVVQAGNACRDIVPGSRVVVCVFDAYRSFVRTTIDRVTIIPDWMSFAQAASIPTAFCTAYFSLLHVARLQKNEKVLIHAASGGTGQAAIQVAQDVGAEVFATVGSLAKKHLLMKVYGIAESHIFYSRDTSFADRVMEATHGEGLDVILNSLAGKQLQASWETIASFGRFVEIGRSDIDSRRLLPMYPFRKNASFTGVDLTLVMGAAEGPAKRRHGKEISQEVMDRIKIGTYKMVHPIHEYEIGDIEHALRFIQGGKSSGKIVVNMSQDSVVPVSYRI
jgi:NADPH:quinone reductase-like Zn-dependent oxidoreductase/ubiquinone/menaquinone biosynthesis C-methylase UbiE